MDYSHGLLEVLDEGVVLEIKVGHARELISHLLDEYNGCNLEDMRKKISWELPRVMQFLEMPSDYVFDIKIGIEKLNEEVERLFQEEKEHKKQMQQVESSQQEKDVA